MQFLWENEFNKRGGDVQIVFIERETSLNLNISSQISYHSYPFGFWGFKSFFFILGFCWVFNGEI